MFKVYNFRISFNLNNGIKIIRYKRARRVSIAVKKAIEEIMLDFSPEEFSLSVEKI